MDETDLRLIAEAKRRFLAGEPIMGKELGEVLGIGATAVNNRIRRLVAAGRWNLPRGRASRLDMEVLRAIRAISARGEYPSRGRVSEFLGITQSTIARSLVRLRGLDLSPVPLREGHGGRFPEDVRAAIFRGLADRVPPTELGRRLTKKFGTPITEGAIVSIAKTRPSYAYVDPTPEEIAAQARAIKAENMREFRKRVARDCSTMSERAKMAYRTPRFEEGWVAGA
jgi:DNA-binding MarR family transcriptional regulator